MPLYDSPRLKQGLSIQKLLTEGVEELVLDEEDVAFKDVPDSERYVETSFDYDEYKGHVNMEVVDSGLADSTFECIAMGMTNVTPDGKVKKKVVRPGTTPVPKDSTVYVNYDFYLEMQEVPVDSSHLRLGRPEMLKIGKNNLIAGFDIAVSSMAVGEKSQFLIHYDYAFRRMGCPPRIPPEAFILAVITVHDVVDCGQAGDEEDHPAEGRRSYAAISSRAASEHTLANDYFMRKKRVAPAVYHYNAEERMLAHCTCSDPKDEKQRRERLFKVYLNLAVCYNHPEMSDSVRAVFFTEKASNIDRERAARSAKLFYLRGVARAGKGEYEPALKDLKKAASIEPKNQEVMKKLQWLGEKIATAQQLEREMSARALGIDSKDTKTDARTSEGRSTDTKTDARTSEGRSTVNGKDEPKAEGEDDVPQTKTSTEANVEKSATDLGDSDEDESEEVSIVRFLEDFKKSSSGQRNLGYGFTAAERKMYKEHSERLGLVYKEVYAGPLRREITITKPTH